MHGEGPRVGFAEATLVHVYQAAFADSVAASENSDSESDAPTGSESDAPAERMDIEEAAATLNADRDLQADKVDLGIESLGALYLEPFWLFTSARDEVRDEHGLRGLLVFAGREGSGTRVLAEALLRINGLDDVRTYSVSEDLSAEEVTELFRRGEVEALFAMGSPMSPVLQRLILDPRIRPFSFDRAEAYDRHFDFITAVSLHEGTVDLERNIPAEELQLLASSIQLVAPDDLNPVLVDALLDAASGIHGAGTLFSARGPYPNGDPASLPLDPTAERFYSEGFAKWRS